VLGSSWQNVGNGYEMARDIETCWKNMEMGGNCVQKQKKHWGGEKNTLRDTIQK
jgi:hypothetical protein